MNRRDFIKGMSLSLLASTAIPARGLSYIGETGMQRPEDRPIKIIGLGTGGAIITKRLLPLNLEGVELILLDRDPSTIKRSPVTMKHLLSPGIRKCGEDYNPEVASRSVLIDREGLKEIIKGAGYVIFVSYIGGNTGSGALPSLIKLTDHILGIKCSAVVSTDFTITARRSNRYTIESIQHKVDELIVIDNYWMIERWDKCKECPVYTDPRIQTDAAFASEHCGRCDNHYSIEKEMDKIDELMVEKTVALYTQKKSLLKIFN